MRLSTGARLLSGVLLVLLGAAAGFAWFASGTLPQVSGTMSLAGLGHPVQVVRDQRGVPHIFAANEADGYFALGVVHAQDRLWQMETLRRVAAGRLSELTGPATVDIDLAMRARGFEARVEGDFAALEAPVRRLIDAYTAGINAAVAQLDRLPPEFIALGAVPEPWRPVDSLLVSKLMSVRLGTNHRDEILFAAMTARLGPGEMKSLYPEWDTGDEEIFRLSVLGLRDFAAGVPVPSVAGLPEGFTSASNAWAVGGGRAFGGRPLLANDPHLGLEAPVLWYLARLNVAGRNVVGATLPGLPFHVLAQNGHIAWGLTTTGADTEDLFVEKVADADPTRYRTPAGTRPFRTETLTIGIRGEPPHSVKLRHTRHGPVVSDIDPDLAALAGKGHVVALSTAVAKVPDTTLAVPWHLAHARNWAEAREALRWMVAPVQNFTIADASGTIARRVAGVVPVRRGGGGMLPAPGWTGSHDWEGFVPFEKLPEVVSGGDGFVANSNNRVEAGEGVVIARMWHSDLRFRRARELINAIPQHDIDSFRVMQADTHAQDADLLLPFLLAQVKPRSETAAEALRRLADWDRRLTVGSVGAIIFEAWLRELNRELFADELKDVFPSFWRYRAPMVARLVKTGSKWCDNVVTANITEDCAEISAVALDRAVAWLSAHVSSEMDEWQWGKVHRVQLNHSLFRRIPVLAWWTDLSRPAPGGHYSLNRGAGPIAPDEVAFRYNHGPGYRAVYDLGNPEQSRFVIATGQSGNPLSRHWGDLVDTWLRGDLFTISGSRDELAGEHDLLILQPEA